ncbi:MAG: hypothetical protein ABI177_14500 [Edaphobacter sp.]
MSGACLWRRYRLFTADSHKDSMMEGIDSARDLLVVVVFAKWNRFLLVSICFQVAYIVIFVIYVIGAVSAFLVDSHLLECVMFMAAEQKQ